ncbi:MAG: YbjN domain-containing protein [Caulobacterales bacterium]
MSWPIRKSVAGPLAGVGFLLAMLAPAASAIPAPLADGGATAQEVAAVLQAKGYQAQIGTDNTGDPKIHSGAEGSGFNIFFYGCHKTPRCASIEFEAAYHIEGGMQFEQINAWNQKNRFGRAYLDNVKDPYIEMDLDMEHGYTSEAIDNNIDTWDAVLSSFNSMLSCLSRPANDPCKAQNP